jgi:cysteine desulfurase/selenocysteine lyase
VTNIPGVLGMGAAIEYLTAIGMRRIEAHNLALRSRLFDALPGVPKLQVVSATRGPSASPLLTFRLPDAIESRAFQERMRQTHKIELKVVPKNWFNGIRVSTHLFNTQHDVDTLVTTLKQELA